MGGVLHSWAWICAVPRHGTCLHRYLRHTLENIACFGWRCSKGSMDDSILPGYTFHDACITNHLALNGPSPLLFGALGEGANLRFVRSLDIRGWALIGAAGLCIALPDAIAALGGSAHAGVTLEERKLPMKFSWVACQPDCRGWVSAVGVVTADSPKDFDDFARGRQLGGVTIVLDSSGGSVNDSIALGPRGRKPRALATARRPLPPPARPRGTPHV